MKKQTNFFEEKLKLISQQHKILDAGSSKPWQKEMAKYKPWFKNCQYESLDLDPNSQATYVADIQKIPLPENSYDAVICKAVLQLVPLPYQAIKEMHRILKPKGLLLAYVPFIYPYHDEHDHWRFSKKGIDRLFRDFQTVEISPVDGFFVTMLNFVPVRFFRKNLNPIMRFTDELFNTKKSSNTSGYNIFAIK